MFDLSQAPQAPVATKKPHTDTHHSITRTDEYAWMRVDNWMEVMADPTVLEVEVRTHLETENDYTKTVMAPTQALQDCLFAEFKGRIKEEDASPPTKDGPWAYFTRFRTGGQYPIYCRKQRDDRGEASAVVLFDGDAEAKGCDYFRLGGLAHSDDHALLAWSVDTNGGEFYVLRIRDLDRNTDLDDTLERVAGGGVWAPDGQSLFYTWQDDNHRPCKVFRHQLGTPQSEDELIFEEKDAGFFVGVDRSSNDQYLVVSAHDHQTSEAWIADLQADRCQLECVAPRQEGHEYDLEFAAGRWYIRTNQDGAVDFKVMVADTTAPGRDHWRQWQDHEPGRLIEALDGYSRFLAILESQNALPRLTVHNLEKGDSHVVDFDEDAYALSLSGAAEYDTSQTRFTYDSPSTPKRVYDYDMATKERNLVKEQEIPSGHNADDYIVRRIRATSHDGAEVPLTVMYHKDTPLDGTAPLYLYGYGSYGMSMPASFSILRLSLAQRGIVTATAHIRGGADMGYGWYLDGKAERKTNTFHDFIAARDALVERGWVDGARVGAEGRSAGGMLIGAVANMAPEKFAALIGGVPFVDVLATMLDKTLPLTPPEWPEWGNPLADPQAYQRLAAYSPIDNVSAQAYPAILATGGLTDPRVTYWEPAKWVATLRERRTDDGLTLLQMNMGAGHGGASGRFDALKEDAHDWAFMLWVLGIKA
jgi:oligopeptidase B